MSTAKNTVEILSPYGRAPERGEPRVFSVFAKRGGRYLLSIVSDGGEGKRLSNHAPVPSHLTDAESFEAQVVLAHHLENVAIVKADGPAALRDATEHGVIPTDDDTDFEAWLDRQDPEAKTRVLTMRVLAAQANADEADQYLLGLGQEYREKVNEFFEQEKVRAKHYVAVTEADDAYVDHCATCATCDDDEGPAEPCSEGSPTHRALLAALRAEEMFLDSRHAFDRKVRALEEELDLAREEADAAKNAVDDAYLLLEEHQASHQMQGATRTPQAAPESPWSTSRPRCGRAAAGGRCTAFSDHPGPHRHRAADLPSA